jgi:hypothetical protein
MKLLLNVKITAQGLSHYDRAEHLPKYDRMDIFKYCLASYSVFEPIVSRFIFFIEVAPEFKHRQQELAEWIDGLFPQSKTQVFWYRNFYTADWRKSCEEIIFDDKDEPIWFAGNDDHIFMDSSLDVLKAGIGLLERDEDPFAVIYYSHWPEQMRLATRFNAELTSCGNFVKFNWRTYDGIRIIKQERFRHYWFDFDYGDTPVFRTDALWHLGHPIVAPVYSPTKELVRHYDGYSHVSKQLVTVAPPLVIPPGFFDHDIKIRYGVTRRDGSLVNINPLAEYLYADKNHPHATDYRWVPADIPLFWQDRISRLEGADIDAGHLRARDLAIAAIVRVPMSCYGFTFTERDSPPGEWLSKHWRQPLFPG